jgi:hypothetical protein
MGPPACSSSVHVGDVRSEPGGGNLVIGVSDLDLHAADLTEIVPLTGAANIRRMSRFVLKFGGDPELAQAT